jgi:hypothetical protein
METLADQELTTANVQLAHYLDAASRASLYLGMTVLFVVAVPATVVILHFIGSPTVGRTAVAGGLLAVAWCAYGFWLHMRARSAFARLRLSCLKLQRAGFVLCMKHEFFRPVLVAKSNTEADSVRTLDFENMTPRQLRATTE